MANGSARGRELDEPETEGWVSGEGQVVAVVELHRLVRSDLASDDAGPVNEVVCEDEGPAWLCALRLGPSTGAHVTEPPCLSARPNPLSQPDLPLHQFDWGLCADAYWTPPIQRCPTSSCCSTPKWSPVPRELDIRLESVFVTRMVTVTCI